MPGGEGARRARFAGASAGDLADDLAPLHRRASRSRPGRRPRWEHAWKWAAAAAGRPSWPLLAISIAGRYVSMVLFIVWHNVSLRGKLDVAARRGAARARQRELDALEDRRLTLLQQEGQKLFDSRLGVAVAAGDWPGAATRPGEGTRHVDHRGQRAPASKSLKELQPRASVEARSSRNSASKPIGARRGSGSSPSASCATRPSSSAPCTPAWTWPPASERPRACGQRRQAVLGRLRSRGGGSGRPWLRCLPRRCAEGRGHGGLLPAPADPRRDRGPVLVDRASPAVGGTHLRTWP